MLRQACDTEINLGGVGIRNTFRRSNCRGVGDAVRIAQVPFLEAAIGSAELGVEIDEIVSLQPGEFVFADQHDIIAMAAARAPVREIDRLVAIRVEIVEQGGRPGREAGAIPAVQIIVVTSQKLE